MRTAIKCSPAFKRVTGLSRNLYSTVVLYAFVRWNIHPAKSHVLSNNGCLSTNICKASTIGKIRVYKYLNRKYFSNDNKMYTNSRFQRHHVSLTSIPPIFIIGLNCACVIENKSSTLLTLTIVVEWKSCTCVGYLALLLCLYFTAFMAFCCICCIALTCAIDAIFYLESFFTHCEMVREYSVSVFEDFIYDGKAWVAPT